MSEGDREHVIKIVNGIDARSNRPVLWSPLQLAVTWTDETTIVAVTEELVLMGADMNGVTLCGLNALHILILLLFFRRSQRHDARMLEWWMSKGVDVHAHSVLFDQRQKEYRILSPLDIIISLYSKTLHLEPSLYLPAYCGPKKRASVPKRQLKKLLGLLVCYGARSSEPCPLLDEVMVTLPRLPFRSLTFLRDYLEVRLKLPLHLSSTDMRERLNFLHRWGRFADHDEIVRCRGSRYYPKTPETESIYNNPNFEPDSEFMPYEYLGYVDTHRRHYFFHKTMVPSILRSGENPFTRETIPVVTLRQWFQDMSQRPYTFQQVFTLRESLDEDGVHLWGPAAATTPSALEDDAKKNFVLHFVHGVLSHNFPYTNILHLSMLHAQEVVYLCSVLSVEYHLTTFAQCPLEGALGFFSKRVLASVMDETFPLDVLHFGIEDGLQDISTFHLVKKLLDESPMSFEDPFLDIIMSLPEVGDVIRDRLGYVHLGYFHEVWQRLVSMNKNFC